MAAPITVTCPMPDCDWDSQCPIDDDYPASLVEMLTGNMRSVREQHISGHGALAWAQAYEKATVVPPLPRRGDAVEAWLKQQRDAAADYPQAYDVADGLLDLYRLHADTGTPLHEHCCEGGNVHDCAGCYDAKEARRG